jgi:hypothetical protein
VLDGEQCVAGVALTLQPSKVVRHVEPLNSLAFKVYAPNPNLRDTKSGEDAVSTQTDRLSDSALSFRATRGSSSRSR